MKYKLIVQRFEKNEDYEREMRDWDERWNRHSCPPEIRPMPERERMALEVSLTEEEFLAIKKAVIEVIK